MIDKSTELAERVIDKWAEQGIVTLADPDGTLQCDTFGRESDVVYRAALAAAGLLALPQPLPPCKDCGGKLGDPSGENLVCTSCGTAWAREAVTSAFPDDEAAIERMALAIGDQFFGSPKWTGEIEVKADSECSLWRDLALVALAALRGEQA